MFTGVLLALATLVWEKPLQDKPLPTLKLIAQADRPGGYWCEVTNPSKTSWYFRGYSPASFQSKLPADRIAPYSQIQRLKNGQWVTEFDGRCGVGIGPVELPAETKASFFTFLRDSEREDVRVGISISPTKDWKHSQNIWSEPVKGSKQ